MRFSISHFTENGLNLVALKDKKSGTQITVLPLIGACLHEFSIRLNDHSFNIVENYKNIEEAKTKASVNYKNSKLSPFPCRIDEGIYFFNNKEYKFQNKFRDGSAIHGLLFQKPFEVIDEMADEKMASLILKYEYKKDDAGYPFDYQCEIRYLLKPDNILKIDTVVSNLSNTEIPIADGWHPYFRLGNNVNECMLRFNKGDMVEFNDKLIPTGKLISYNLFNESTLLNDVFLDNCFIPAQKNGEAICEIYNPINKLKISFFTNGSYPYLQIFTPDDRKSIAIENLSGAPNCFNNKMGLTLLQPRHSKTFTVYYQANIG